MFLCDACLLALQVGAVVVGFDKNINYYKIQYACLCIRENPGCLFIATNLDAVTHLTDAQEWAGNGAMVGAIKGLLLLMLLTVTLRLTVLRLMLMQPLIASHSVWWLKKEKNISVREVCTGKASIEPSAVCKRHTTPFAFRVYPWQMQPVHPLLRRLAAVQIHQP